MTSVLSEDFAFDEVGVTGLPRMAGQVTDEWLRDLKGEKAIKAYREMRDNEPVVGAVLSAIRMLGAAVDWPVLPGGDQPKDAERAAYVASCFDDMSLSWDDQLSEIYSMNWAGWAWFEVVYKRRGGDTDDPESRSTFADGMIGWRKWAFRSQQSRVRWDFDETGGVQALVQRPGFGAADITIPIEKSLLFRTQTELGNPEGRSLLRNAYVPWIYKTRIQNFEAIGIERDLGGLPVAQVKEPTATHSEVPDPWNAKDADAVALLANLKKMVETVRVNEKGGVVLPWFVDLKLLTAGGQQRIDTSKIVTRYTAAIAQSMLADFILLGQSASGSRALAEPKIDLFLTGLNGLNQRVASVINRFAIPPLARLNGWPPSEPLPYVQPKDVKTVDLGALGDYVTKLASAGMTLFPTVDGRLEAALLEAGDLPSEGLPTARGDDDDDDE